MSRKTLSIFCMMIFLTIILYSEDKVVKPGKIYVPLPGDKMNTEDTIQKLLMVKRFPIQKKEAQNQDFKLETEIIQDFSKYLHDLDTKSRALYDFQNPFGEMTGESSDEKILETYATRKAKKQNYKVTVFQTAKPDSFMSQSLARNKVLPASEFTITIGAKSKKVKFMGGTISQLANVIQEQAGELVEIKTVNDTPSTMILVVSGKATGEKNRMVFDGDLKALFDAGLLVNGSDKIDEYTVDFTKIVSKNSNPIASDARSVVIKPDNEGEVTISDKTIEVKDNTVLTFGARINKISQDTQGGGTSVPNVDISLMEPVTVSNVTVGGGSLISFYEEKKELPALVSNFTEIFTVEFNDGAVKSYFIDQDGIFSNALTSYKGKTITKVIVNNKNTDRSITVSDVKFTTKLEEGGIQPKNAITKACDALLNLDGVEVRRDKNNIDDLIDGLTLNAKEESKEPVNVKVDHNYKKVEDSIMAWVDAYNKSMEYLSILTKPSQDRTPLSERNQQNLKDGIFQTETSFISLRNKLRNDAINAYKTDLGRELALLEQIGIFTKKAGSFSMQSEEWNTAKMGLLNADTDKLKEALKTKFEGVSQLFANDITGGQVKDSGIAVSINQDLRMAIGAGSFIERRIAFNGTKIQENNKAIDELNRGMSDYELQLRQKYGKMNQAISESESKQKWLNNQFKGQ